MNSKASPSEPLVICDASPVILLAKVSCLHLIRELASDVWMPVEVWREIRAGAPLTEIASIEAELGFTLVDADPDLLDAYSLLVDRGEAAALAVAAKAGNHCFLLMDDRRGRSIASAAGFKTMGTLGLLARSHRAGKLQSLSTVFRRLQTHGWYIDPKLIEAVLIECGESGKK